MSEHYIALQYGNLGEQEAYICSTSTANYSNDFKSIDSRGDLIRILGDARLSLDTFTCTVNIQLNWSHSIRLSQPIALTSLSSQESPLEKPGESS